jgi:hypothetical protein
LQKNLLVTAQPFHPSDVATRRKAESQQSGENLQPPASRLRPNTDRIPTCNQFSKATLQKFRTKRVALEILKSTTIKNWARAAKATAGSGTVLALVAKILPTPHDKLVKTTTKRKEVIKSECHQSWRNDFARQVSSFNSAIYLATPLFL